MLNKNYHTDAKLFCLKLKYALFTQAQLIRHLRNNYD